MKEVKFIEKQKTLPVAEKIYLMLFDRPTTHAEWAEMFNKIAIINISLIVNVS